MTTEDFAPCVVIYPNGTIRKANVRHVRMDTAESALEKLRKDTAAWVSYQTYDALQDRIKARQWAP